MQDGATAQCSGEMGHRIRAEHQREPRGPQTGSVLEMSTSVWISPEARGDRGVHPPDIDPPVIPRRMRLTRDMFERFGLTAQCLGCRAIRTGIGYPANHTERCRERIEQELEKEPEGASRVARDRERIKRARHEERARDMRDVDPEQRPDREVTEGTGASSSRDGAGNEQEATGGPVAMSEPQPRPAEPCVGDGQPPREHSDDADMADPDSDRRRPRESLGEERENKESQDQCPWWRRKR